MRKGLFFFLCMSAFFSSFGQDYRIEGHRGFRGNYPENTLEGFEEALKLGVQVLEMDVCITKDQQVVVSHEPYMNPLFCIKPDGQPVAKEELGKFNLYQMTYAEIKQFDTGSMGNVNFPEQIKMKTHKPLLSEVLELGEKYRKKLGKPIYYNVEIKSEPKEYGRSQPKTVQEFSDLVAKVLFTKIDPAFIILQSFDFNVLKFWNESIKNGHFPKLTLAALVEKGGPDEAVQSLGFTPDIYSPYYHLLNKTTFSRAKELGMKVVPWTINDEEEIKKYLDMGVDAVITDYPNRALEFL